MKSIIQDLICRWGDRIPYISYKLLGVPEISLLFTTLN